MEPRYVCYTDKNGLSGICLNYGNRGNCEECSIRQNLEKNLSDLAWVAWKGELE